METKIITSRNELRVYQQDILDLFQRSFEKKLSVEQWQWAYIENPCGEPVVALCFENNTLVGHYAVIPMKMINSDKSMKACLSMTTMVCPSCRGRGLFRTLAQAVYRQCEALGFEFVYGFPNDNSAPGFKKYLQWSIDEDDFVAKVTKQDLLKSRDLKTYLTKIGSYHFPVLDKKITSWRFSKPGVNYRQCGDSVIKAFADSFDIIYLSENYAAELEGDITYHLL